MPDAPSIDLYWIPGSCARIPFVALEEAGVAFDLHVLDRGAGDNVSDEYRAINPKLRVPTLVIDDWVITENSAMSRRVPRASACTRDARWRRRSQSSRSASPTASGSSAIGRPSMPT